MPLPDDVVLVAADELLEVALLESFIWFVVAVVVVGGRGLVRFGEALVEDEDNEDR